MRPENERVIKEIVRFLMKMEEKNGYFEFLLKGESGNITHWAKTEKAINK